jgi:uracil-DNA glycosylase family 4
VGELSRGAKEIRWEKMQRFNEVLRRTTDPYLLNLRKGKNYVPGRGSLFPGLVFIGEAPGRNENAMRMPFIGASGRILDDLLESVGITRDSVYITNTVKWWPTLQGNTRPPQRQEKEACRPYLVRELAIVAASRVVTLGRHATDALLPKGAERARWHKAEGLPFYVLPLYHPAAAIYRQALRSILFEEFKKVTEDPRATE